MSKVKVEDLWVKVSYEVRLGDLEIPKAAFDEIIEATNQCREIKMSDDRFNEAFEYLSHNIKEADCMDWECEVIDITAKDNA